MNPRNFEKAINAAGRLNFYGIKPPKDDDYFAVPVDGGRFWRPIPKGGTDIFSSEEVADLAVRGVLSIHELFVKHGDEECVTTANKWGHPIAIFGAILKEGCYFPQPDRIAHYDSIDVINDGLPKFATFSSSPRNPNFSYLDTAIISPVRDHDIPLYKRRAPPFMAVKNSDMKPYHFAWFSARNKKSRHDRSLVSSYETTIWLDVKTGRCYPTAYEISNSLHENNAFSTATVIFPLVCGLFADRKYLWLVEAWEKTGWNNFEAKAVFGVHETHIQSLFYARNLPVSDTGRKRPILHWVNAHLRRIKEGVIVNVREHMRGIIEFEMLGQRFRITQPVK